MQKTQISQAHLEVNDNYFDVLIKVLGIDDTELTQAQQGTARGILEAIWRNGYHAAEDDQRINEAKKSLYTNTGEVITKKLPSLQTLRQQIKDANNWD